MAYKRKTVTKKEAKSLLKKGGTKMMPAKKKPETIKIEGYSVGDWSVGIGSIPFQIDTGLYELEDYEKENIIKTLIRDIWEMHDNGTLRYEFSDEHNPLMYGRRFTWQDSQKILEERRKENGN